MKAKDLLLHYEDCVRRERMLKSEIMWTRKKLDSLDRITTQTTRKMKIDRANIEEKIHIYEEDLVRIPDERRKIIDLISDIPDIEREVLTRRYVDGQIWDEICESMFFSLSMIHRIHRRALQMVQERLDNGTFSTLYRQ